jgi:hypothetical protein
MALSNDGNTFYLSIQNGKTYKMKLDVQNQPTEFTRIDPVGGSSYDFINPFIIDPNNDNIMYMSDGMKIWRNDSLNYIPLSGSYEPTSQGWFKMAANTLYSNASVSALAVAKSPANRLFYGTGSRRVYRVDSANVGDPVHILINDSTIFPNGNVSCIALDPENSDKIIIVYSNYGIYSLFYTENGGTNWQKIGGNLEANINGTGTGPSCRWASFIHSGDSLIHMVATSVGMFYTTKLQADSTVWIQAGDNIIGNVVCEMIKVRQQDGTIAIATHGNGAYTATLNTTNIEHGKKSKIDVQLYPNPASDWIFIKGNSLDMANVRIFSYSGQLIKKENIQMNTGINVSSIQSGFYIVEVETENNKFTKKIFICR